MEITSLRSFANELTKLAALTPEESAVFKQVVRNQAKFDMETSGANEAQKELHRQNTKRMQEFANKRKDDKYKIPGWAKDPDGKMPGGSTRPASGGYGPGGFGRPFRNAGPKTRKVIDWAIRNPRTAVGLTGAGLMGLTGLGSGASSTALETKRMKQERMEEAKEQGPASEWIAENPVKATAGLGALAGGVGGAAAMHYGLQRGSVPLAFLAGTYGTLVASALGIHGANKYLKARQAAQSVSQPDESPMAVPKMPKAA